MKLLLLRFSKKGSALLIGIFVTTIVILIAIYLLEKIIPFSRDIRGVENGNISYYRANTALNEALLSMSGSDPSIEGSAGNVTNGSGNTYQITANGTILPASGLGNSEYAKDWAILAPGKPIQLILKSSSSIDWSTSVFNFRVPDLNKNDNWLDQTLSGGTTIPIINWSLTSSGDTLQSSGSQIMASEITGGDIYFGPRQGLILSGSSDTFNAFYNNPLNCSSTNICTLKLSLINPLVLTSGENAPYLEYQAHFNTPIPLQTSVIETQGYIGGFRKNITRFIQQITTNEALDFTVFQ